MDVPTIATTTQPATSSVTSALPAPTLHDPVAQHTSSSQQQPLAVPTVASTKAGEIAIQSSNLVPAASSTHTVSDAVTLQPSLNTIAQQSRQEGLVSSSSATSTTRNVLLTTSGTRNSALDHDSIDPKGSLTMTPSTEPAAPSTQAMTSTLHDAQSLASWYLSESQPSISPQIPLQSSEPSHTKAIVLDPDDPTSTQPSTALQRPTMTTRSAAVLDSTVYSLTESTSSSGEPDSVLSLHTTFTAKPMHGQSSIVDQRLLPSESATHGSVSTVTLPVLRPPPTSSASGQGAASGPGNIQEFASTASLPKVQESNVSSPSASAFAQSSQSSGTTQLQATSTSSSAAYKGNAVNTTPSTQSMVSMLLLVMLWSI